MKKKIFVACMIMVGAFLAAFLFAAMISGAPIGSSQLRGYVICAAVVAVLLPAGFVYFFISTVKLSKKLEEQEADVRESEKSDDVQEESPVDMPVSVFVSAFAEKRSLTKEAKEELKAYLEELEDNDK